MWHLRLYVIFFWWTLSDGSPSLSVLWFRKAQNFRRANFLHRFIAVPALTSGLIWDYLYLDIICLTPNLEALVLKCTSSWKLYPTMSIMSAMLCMYKGTRITHPRRFSISNQLSSRVNSDRGTFVSFYTHSLIRLIDLICCPFIICSTRTGHERKFSRRKCVIVVWPSHMIINI